MFFGTGCFFFFLRIFSFRYLPDKKRSKFLLTYLVVSPNILYWNFSFSVVTWNLQLDEVLIEVGDEDLLEEDKIDELEEVKWRRRFWLLWYLHVYMWCLWASFTEWLWSNWRWVWRTACYRSLLFLLLWWLGKIVWKANYLIVRWRLLGKDSHFRGQIFVSLTTIVCHYLVETIGINLSRDQIFDSKFKLYWSVTTMIW